MCIHPWNKKRPHDDTTAPKRDDTKLQILQILMEAKEKSIQQYEWVFQVHLLFRAAQIDFVPWSKNQFQSPRNQAKTTNLGRVLVISFSTWLQGQPLQG